jgi:predicted acylesterase/phospholipase RssA/CRP-like cAMP-binding protein
MNAAAQNFRNTIEHYFGISVSDGDPLLAEMKEMRVAGGDWLIRQGDPGDALYLLVRGRLQAWAGAHGAGAIAKPVFLGEIVPGDSVGEVSLLTGEPRAASIQAIRDSLLVKIDRTAFEKLAQEHPSLVMKLAGNVASMLHKSTTGTQAAVRNMRTIAIIPLDDTPRVQTFCHQLLTQLNGVRRTLSLSPESLGREGAPVDSLDNDSPLPQSLRHWISDQESADCFVIFRCPAADTSWARFAQRQSDLVLLIGDARHDPQMRDWERSLAAADSAAIARRMLVLLQSSQASAIQATADWLSKRKADFHVHVREDHPEDVGRVSRIISGTATGVVLAGGAARGLAHLGVYKALKELGIVVDWVGGTSIGAIMAAVIACDWDVEEAIRLGKEAFVDGKPFGDYTVPLMSLLRGRRMERLLKEYLDFQIEDLPTPFFCVSCNLDAGTLNLHETGPLTGALRASAALPGILPPAVVDNQLAIDGAVINNMPVDIMQQKPVGAVIAVDLASQKNYHVEYQSMPSPWAVLRGRYLPFSRKHRVPALSTLMLKATELGTLGRVRDLGKRADLLLNPPVRKFGMTEVKSYDRIVEAGYQHARDELGAWLEGTGSD